MLSIHLEQRSLVLNYGLGSPMRVMGPESGFCALSVGFAPYIRVLCQEWGSWALNGGPNP